MADAGAWRYDPEVAESVLSPAQEHVAFLVAIDLEPRVDEVRRIGAVFIDLYGVVDDEIDRLQWIDALRVAAELHDRIAHRREIDDGGRSEERRVGKEGRYRGA